MKTNKQQKGILLTAVSMLAVIAVVIVIGLSLPEREEYIQGEVETTDYRVSCKVPSRVLQIRVAEGDCVRRGDTLAVMEAPDMAARLAQAEAARSAAEALELKARNGSRQEQIQAAYEVWQQARAGLQVAEKTFRRIERLHGEGVVAAQKFDEAQAQYNAMTATASAAKAQYDLAVDGASKEEKAAAAAQVRQAAGVVSEVESYLSDAMVYSPVTGEISTIIAEQGELVGSGYPVVAILDMSDMWVTFNIKETLMPKIRMGKRLRGYVPALDRDVDFHITYIAPQADFATWAATRTQGGFDIRTFAVKAKPLGAEEGMRPGMSVLVDWDAIE